MTVSGSEKTTVSRDGVVTRGGEIIGHVKKEMRQGAFATLVGVSASSGGTAYFVPFAGDGTRLSDGYETRKRAVARIEKHATPLTVSGLKLERGGLLFSDAECVTASVEYQGYYFGVSRYADEAHWVIDYLSTPDSIMPVFSNGTGTRATAARVLKDEFADAATQAAIAAGLWPIPAAESE
jgi:hypothetical protein